MALSFAFTSFHSVGVVGQNGRGNPTHLKEVSLLELEGSLLGKSPLSDESESDELLGAIRRIS